MSVQRGQTREKLRKIILLTATMRGGKKLRENNQTKFRRGYSTQIAVQLMCACIGVLFLFCFQCCAMQRTNFDERDTFLDQQRTELNVRALNRRVIIQSIFCDTTVHAFCGVSGHTQSLSAPNSSRSHTEGVAIIYPKVKEKCMQSK